MAFKRKRQQEGQVRKRRTHHNVRKALLVVALFLLLLVAPVFVNNAIGYMPVMAYAIVLALCFAYPRIVAANLEYDLLSSCKTCVRGSDAKILIRFCNQSSLLAPKVEARMSITDIFGDEDTSSDFIFSLGAKSQRDFNLGASFAHVGTVSVQVKDVAVYDPFGLFYRTLGDTARFEVEILPRTHDIDASLARRLKLQETMEAPTPFNRDGMEYAGVREYEYGDPIKSIHWKLSSHADELYTRIFDAVGEPSLSVMCGVVFPQGAPQTLMSLYDAELETALSVCSFAAGNALRCSLQFGTGGNHDEIDVFDASRGYDVRDIIREFPRPGSVAVDALPDFIAHATMDRRGGNLVVCTSLLSDGLLEALVTASAGEGRIVLFCMVPEGLDSTERADYLAPLRRLEQSKVDYFAIEQSQELEAILYE